MSDPDLEKLSRLATLAASDVGASEEEVKVNFAVPFLEALGHSRLRLEYKQRDIVVHSGGRRPLSVVVETKRAGEPLDRHLDQLARYAAEERCFLALLTNGDVVRFYAPPWPGVESFEDALLWEIRREDLANRALAGDVAACLSPQALASGEAADLIALRQQELDSFREKVRRAEEEAQDRHDALAARLRELDRQAASIERERVKLRAEVQEVDAHREAVIAEAYATARVPRPARRASAPGSPAAGKPWRDEELFDGATETQRRVLRAFVKADRRSLGTKELAALSGLSPQRANGALAAFARATKAGLKETLFEVTKPPGKGVRATGVVYTLAEKYWDTVRRLYPG